MTQRAGRNSWQILALVILGPVCCLALPLLLVAGAGAGLWIIGAGIPLVLATLAGGFVIARWWRTRSSRFRDRDGIPPIVPNPTNRP